MKVYEEKDELFSIGVGRTKDKKFVVLGSRVDRHLGPVAAARGDAGRRASGVVLPREKGHKYDVEHRDGILFIRTNKDAKNFRLVTAPLADPSPAQLEAVRRAPARTCCSRTSRSSGTSSWSRRSRRASTACASTRFADGAWKEVAFPEPVYTAFAARHAGVRLDAAPLQLPEPHHALERLRLRHGGRRRRRS